MADVLNPAPIPNVTSPLPRTYDNFQAGKFKNPEALKNSVSAESATPDSPYKADLLNPFKPVTNPYLWKRIGIGVMGGLFIWWGILAFLATNKKIQSTIISGAKGALSKTPQGAVANLATDAIGS